ncbi:MAG: hydrolase 1, exosortase A system-associated [Kiloniellaceae bacterium]
MRFEEVPLTFACGGAQLVGILHRPARPLGCGVVVVVGAPQYRTGSHRHFALLARDLAGAGFPVLRFDYRGMGDSDGEFVGFEGVGEDIKAAVDSIMDAVSGLRDVVLWGLCDGASAISFYAARDPRVSGIVLVNPWVRSEASLAQARISHYYRGRLLSADFWRKAARGKLDLKRSAGELISSVRSVLGGRAPRDRATDKTEPLPVRVARSVKGFRGRVLIVLSEADLTAQEFRAAVLQSAMMAGWLDRPSVTVKRLEAANHTYSTREWRGQVHRWTIEWLKQAG